MRRIFIVAIVAFTLGFLWGQSGTVTHVEACNWQNCPVL
jgi:hypothetical protein